MSKITASKNTFDDGTTLYDEYGNVVGRQYKDSFGDGVTTYDQYGNTVARSYGNSFDDGVTTYDQYGNRIATTYGHSFDDGSTTYDQYGNRIADTYQNTFDPGSSTTYFTGAAGAGYAAGASSYSSGYDSSYSSGYTSSYIPTGGYAGGYSPPDPRTLRKNRICGVFVTLGIIGLVLDFIYGLVGIIKPDLISLDLAGLPCSRASRWENSREDLSEDWPSLHCCSSTSADRPLTMPTDTVTDPHRWPGQL